MAVNIGPKIGIDGEKQYRAEIQQIIQQGKTLKSQMDAVSSAYQNADDKEKALTDVSKTLNDQIKNQSALVDKLKDAVAKSTAKTGENSETTLKWKEQLHKAETELNKMSGQTAESAAGVEEFAKQEGKATEKTRIFGDVLKANLLSEAIKSGMKFLVDNAKKLGKEISSAATGAAAYADEINTLSKQTSITTDTLQEYRYASKLLDVELSTITGAHSKLTKAIASADKGTGAQAETFAALGVEIRDANGELRSANDIFDDTITALGKMDNETERDAAAMQIFGKSAQELNPLIEAGADQLAAFRKEAHDTGAVLDGETLDTLQRAQDNMDRMSKAAETLKNKIGAKIFAEFNDDLEEATSIMQDFASGKASPAQIEKRLEKLFDSVFKKLETAGGKAAPYVGKAFEKIFDFAAKNFPKVADRVLEKLPGVFDKIGKGAEKYLPKLLNTIGNVLASIMSNTPALLKAGLEMIVSIGKGVIKGLPDFGKSLIKGLSVPFGEAAQEAQKQLASVKDAIKELEQTNGELAGSIADVDAKQREAQKWLDIYDDLTGKTELSKTEQQKLNQAVERLQELYPELGSLIDDESGTWKYNTAQIRDNITALSDRAKAQAYYDAAGEALKNQIILEGELQSATEKRKDAENRKTNLESDLNSLRGITEELAKTDREYLAGAKSADQIISGLSDDVKNYAKQNGITIESMRELRDVQSIVTQENFALQDSLRNANEEISNYDQTIADATAGLEDYQKQIDYFFRQGDKWTAAAQTTGTEIIKGIERGMVAERQSLLKTGTDSINSLISQMKRTAEIKSPSRVTRDEIGKNLGLGIVEGYDDVMTAERTRRSFDMQSIIDAMKTGGTNVTNNNQSATTNLGGVAINVYAAENHDANAIAKQVLAEFTNMYNSKKAVFA